MSTSVMKAPRMDDVAKEDHLSLGRPPWSEQAQGPR